MITVNRVRFLIQTRSQSLSRIQMVAMYMKVKIYVKFRWNNNKDTSRVYLSLFATLWTISLSVHKFHSSLLETGTVKLPETSQIKVNKPLKCPGYRVLEKEV